MYAIILLWSFPVIASDLVCQDFDQVCFEVANLENVCQSQIILCEISAPEPFPMHGIVDPVADVYEITESYWNPSEVGQYIITSYWFGNDCVGGTCPEENANIDYTEQLNTVIANQESMLVSMAEAKENQNFLLTYLTFVLSTAIGLWIVVRIVNWLSNSMLI